MDKNIIFALNHSTLDQIYTHLKSCDEQFVPALSSKIDVQAYAEKIHQKAILFEAFHDSLVGLVAAYHNKENHFLFITNVSVMKEFGGRGIAKKLMHQAIQYAIEKNIPCIKLEVNKKNEAALQLYYSLKFKLDHENEESFFLQYDTNH